jgi:type I restriction enzyme M protein
MMPSFNEFNNPFKDPKAVPENYRKNLSLQRLFKADGTYVRPAEDPVTMWAIYVLHEEYKVPLEAMQLELPAQFSIGVNNYCMNASLTCTFFSEILPH